MGSGSYLTHLARLSLVLVGLAFSDAVAVEPENQLVIAHAGAEQTVFSWETQRCDDEDIPDSGLRLFRRHDGQIIGIASHTRTRLFKVSNYGIFTRKCDVVHESSHSSDSADYADATWIAATWTDDGRVVHALGHNEYRANQHWFACRYRAYLSCWYNTIVAMRSVDGGQNFTREDAPPIAAPNFTQDAYQGSPRGFFDPTNIVRLDDAYYTIVFASGGPDQPSGNCLLRTQEVSDPARWTLFDGQDFVVSIRDPYRAETAHEHLCAPLENLDGRVTGLVRHEPSGLFVASLAAQAPNADKGWIGFSLSQDLLTWSRPQILMEVPTIWSRNCDDAFRYAYPSLTDISSTSRNFETIGDAPQLHLTRIIVKHCSLTLQRDLVRLPVSIVSE